MFVQLRARLIWDESAPCHDVRMNTFRVGSRVHHKPAINGVQRSFGFPRSRTDEAPPRPAPTSPGKLPVISFVLLPLFFRFGKKPAALCPGRARKGQEQAREENPQRWVLALGLFSHAPGSFPKNCSFS